MESGFSRLWYGGVDYTASPFPEHNYWSCGTGHGFISSSVPVTCEGSHADLSGLGPDCNCNCNLDTPIRGAKETYNTYIKLYYKRVRETEFKE